MICKMTGKFLKNQIIYSNDRIQLLTLGSRLGFNIRSVSD